MAVKLPLAIMDPQLHHFTSDPNFHSALVIIMVMMCTQSS